MPRTLQIVPSLPSLRTAVERFLARSRFAARTRESYAQELKRFSGHLSLRSLEVYIAHNREAAKRKARTWERRDTAGA